MKLCSGMINFQLDVQGCFYQIPNPSVYHHNHNSNRFIEESEMCLMPMGRDTVRTDCSLFDIMLKLFNVSEDSMIHFQSSFFDVTIK